MLKLSSLKPYKGATRRRKVVGRGVGSGHGTFSGRGAKGQKARSGGKIPVGFEGGRMPLHRQLPKRRGFTSRSPKAQTVSLKVLAEKFEAGATVNPQTLVNKGIVKTTLVPVKILGTGELTKALNLEKVMVSESARAQIEKAGGSIVQAKSSTPTEAK